MRSSLAFNVSGKILDVRQPQALANYYIVVHLTSFFVHNFAK